MGKRKNRKKQKIGHSNGTMVRRRLVAICKYLGVSDATWMKNIELLVQIRERREVPIGIGRQESAQLVIAWFEENEPKALANLRPKKKQNTEYKKRREFYQTWEWRTVRMQALKEHGATCQCCGATRNDTDMSGRPVRICVDHIKPLATHWELRLDKNNLQILCDECNQGKGAWDETDWRVDAMIEKQLEYKI